MVLGCNQSARGLVAYFQLDEGAGSSIVDCSGNNLTGTLDPGGIGWGKGVSGSALAVDGGRAIVEMSSVLQFSGSVTVTAWVNFTENPVYLRGDAGVATVVSKTDGPPDRQWTLETQPNDPPQGPNGYFDVSNDGTIENYGAYTPTIPLNTWVHLAGVFSPDSIPLVYYDGQVSPATGNTASAMNVSAQAQLVLGGRTENSNFGWVGLLDEVRVYNYALSAAEIAAIYNTTGP